MYFVSQQRAHDPFAAMLAELECRIFAAGTKFFHPRVDSLENTGLEYAASLRIGPL